MQTDVIILGAGAAGLMCAGIAGQRGLKVRVLDHASKLAEKIRISGGGRCNFTNLHAQPQHYLSHNPHFCRSALARYTPADFVALVRQHRIGFHEKHQGQLFCDESSEAIIQLLLRECAAGNVSLTPDCQIDEVRTTAQGFAVDTHQGVFQARSLVVATGGLSIPKIGATDLGYKLARQFGLKIIEPRPGLVPLTFSPDTWQPFAALAGASLQVAIHAKEHSPDARFVEDLLFTHRGLSGPAMLQISNFWRSGETLSLDLLPTINLADALIASKHSQRQSLVNVLATYLPRRLAETWLAHHGLDEQKKLADLPNKVLQQLGHSLQDWRLMPSGSEGFKKAEVTLGGVDTRGLSSNSMMAQHVPGLYFIGEVVDVTGWLGGYNFQWAWASAHAAAQALQ